MSAWSHLPNARHIDWVIKSVEKYPNQWDAAWRAAGDAAHDAFWRAVDDATDDATYDATYDAAWNAARVVGASATLALIVYDDCAHLLEMSSEQLKMWAALTEQPAAALLLPAVIARESIAQLESLQT